MDRSSASSVPSLTPPSTERNEDQYSNINEKDEENNLDTSIQESLPDMNEMNIIDDEVQISKTTKKKKGRPLPDQVRFYILNSTF